MTGIAYAAAGVSGCGKFGRFRNEPDRRNTAATRSGYRVVITSDQMPPPECPHRAQGTVASSGCFACDDNSPSALRKAWAEQRAIPFLRQRLPVEIVRCGGAVLGRVSSRSMLVHDHAAESGDAGGKP